MADQASPNIADWPDWASCPKHEWRVYGDYELGGDRTEVICIHCEVPGERDDKTGDVWYPTT